MAAQYQMAPPDGGGGGSSVAAQPQIDLFNGLFDYTKPMGAPTGFSPMPDSYNMPYIFPNPNLPVPMPQQKSPGFGLKDQLVPGLPNYALYGGVVLLAYLFATRRK